MPIEMIVSVTGVKYTNGDGYYFRLSQKLHNKLYLNCQVKSCRVRGNVVANYDKDDEIKYKGNHNHPPDFYETEFCELERRILERSANEVLPLRRIFLEETMGASPRAVTRLNYPSFLRRMQRRRQYTKRTIPRSLADFSNLMQSPDFADFAHVNGQPFFISEVGNHSILFISPVMRDLMKTEDQTYSIYQFRKFVCQTLKQILIVVKIHQFVAYPVAYVGMQVRSKTAYSEILEKIQEEEPLWNPTILYVGTDPTLCSAIKKVFESCEIINSWFHFAQEMRKEIRNLDLIDLLHSELQFYQCIQILELLPLLPPDKLEEGLEAVKEKLSEYLQTPGIVQLLEYVKNFWFIGNRAQQLSLFDDPSRSNIELKLLNRQLMHSIRGNSRQDAIWSFTRSLVVLEKKYSDAYLEFTMRGSPPKWTGNCSFKTHEKKIRNCVSLFASNKISVDKFLEDMSRSNITSTLDLNDDGDIEFADDNSEEDDDDYDEEPRTSKKDAVDTCSDSSDHVKSEFLTNNNSMDYDDFIVEEVEEREFSDSESVQSIDIKVENQNKNSESTVCIKKVELIENDEETNVSPKQPVTATTISTEVSRKRKLLLVFTPDSPKVHVQEQDLENVTHLCVVCKKHVYFYACQPCGHMCLCDHCCEEFVNKKCPMCSKTTLWVQKIFLPHPLS